MVSIKDLRTVKEASREEVVEWADASQLLLLLLDDGPDSSCLPLVISAAEENTNLHNHPGQARGAADFDGKNTAWLSLPDDTLRGNDGPRASVSAGL
ncbi:hypothetical protein HPB47_015456 [Ixodes persulcatus]|uniref:Uncharacterized protein n=1 Tax=Ixodes persulcatus TaxID=34615 RepID=A0AC60QX14_IXOPE|nr:hypothetical protein HPB47_015456 [Ixodes persulcatus]